MPVTARALVASESDSPLLVGDRVIGYDDLGRPIHQAVFDPTMTFNSSTNDAQMLGLSNNYTTVWSATTATYVWVVTTGGAGQNAYGSPTTYEIRRTAVIYDTSALPSSVTIIGATLRLHVTSLAGTFNLQVQSGAPVYPHVPVVAADYDKSLYSGNGGQLSSAAMFAGGYNTLTLNATGQSWITKAGQTKFMLRSDRDIAGTTPTGPEIALFYIGAAGNPAQLVVDYISGPPTITAVDASAIATTTAQLNSLITDAGGSPNCTVRFGYGTTSHIAGDFLLYDNVTAWVAGYGLNDAPYYSAASLSSNTTYYYRAQISNDNSTATSSNEISFTTSVAIGVPTVFFAYPAVDAISLNWAMPTGASQVLIRSRTDTYPTTTADGTLVVLSAIGTYDYTGLTGGTTYYFSAWGESGGGYSASYRTLVVTTQGTTNQVSGGETIPAPSVPTDWGQSPDASGLSHLQPIYDAVNGVLTEMGIPNGNGWMILAYFIIAIAGVILLVKTRSAFGTVMVVFVLMAGASAVHIIPGWSMLLLLPFAAGSWALERTFL